ncbi:M48 family metallopeptidase [Flavisphingomonas formosensis]|uniref:M48 family metallopeptidase n=1 Tax=Flavisphingomonas formosensis TaxID=861534 RepID=UPI0012FCEF5F|nr:M48 family metallopeptidase [Sphingomonas formosensis]
MAQFDPDTATAAYLATLSPQQHATAIAYTHGDHWLLLWGWLVTIAAAWLIVRFGLLTALRDRVRRPNLAVLACVIAYIALDWLIELPWSIYASWGRERSYGLSSQPFTGWFGENIMSLLISMVMFSLLLLAIYALMRRAPRRWWIWSGAVSAVAIIVLVVLSPVLIEPLFNSYTPAPAGKVRDTVVALAKDAGVPSDKILIYNGSKQSNRYTANVSGLFGSARIAMSDTMFQQGADLAEVRGVVGHEMGHYKRGHIFWSAMILSLLAVLAFWAADRLFPAACAWLGATGIRGIADPAGLPVLMAIVATLGLIGTPLTNTLTRLQEADADRFSLEHAHEPDGLAKALVKTVAYRASSPSRLEEIIFYDHPSVERRIHRAMVWKADHAALVGK